MLYDVSSSYVEGRCCPLAKRGYNRDGKKGKAQIVFIENENSKFSLFSDVTVRFGMDGAWVGANYGNSYFALTVDPGVHHLCASWQSALERLQKNVDLTSLTAEPGQVYYFAAQVTLNSRDNPTFGLSQLNEDEVAIGSKTRCWCNKPLHHLVIGATMKALMQWLLRICSVDVRLFPSATKLAQRQGLGFISLPPSSSTSWLNL